MGDPTTTHKTLNSELYSFGAISMRERSEGKSKDKKVEEVSSPSFKSNQVHKSP